MRIAHQHGFTLLEVTVAAFLLTAGIGALVGTAAAITRLVVRGRQAARVTQAATGQFELLRSLAARAPGACTSLADGADALADGTAWTWRIAPSGSGRAVTVAVSVPVPGGRAVDTLTSFLSCP